MTVNNNITRWKDEVFLLFAFGRISETNHQANWTEAVSLGEILASVDWNNFLGKCNKAPSTAPWVSISSFIIEWLIFHHNGRQMIRQLFTMQERQCYIIRTNKVGKTILWRTRIYWRAKNTPINITCWYLRSPRKQRFRPSFNNHSCHLHCPGPPY